MMELQVVKIGGHLIEKKEDLKNFLKEFALLPSPKILIHGGGKRATEISKSLGLEVKMIEGRRITTDADLEIAVMVYAGLINKQIVSQLQVEGCDSLGVSGADLNLLRSKLRPKDPIDFGQVGDIDVDGVNVPRIKQLLDNGITPVFSAITHNGKGQLLNTNADTVASVIATSLVSNYQVSLNYCFEQKGVLDENGEVINTLNHDDFETKKESKVIKEGMIPKLSNAFNALESGVKTVWIKQADQLTGKVGTKLVLK